MGNLLVCASHCPLFGVLMSLVGARRASWASGLASAPFCYGCASRVWRDVCAHIAANNEDNNHGSHLPPSCSSPPVPLTMLALLTVDGVTETQFPHGGIETQLKVRSCRAPCASRSTSSSSPTSFGLRFPPSVGLA